MLLNSTQQQLIRNRPQSTRLNLSVFQPNTIFQARVNDGSIVRGARVINFDTVSLGSYLSIESGMTMLVGTSLGARDVGKIRVKSTTSGAITVSENSHILWQDNLYITVLRYWEVWPVYPRIIPDSSPDEVQFFKDFDDIYVNQNTILGVFPCAGTHKAGWAGEQFYFSASGTTHLVAGTALTYNWAFEGGTVTGSTSQTPGYITFPTAGQYVVRLIVSGANGSVDTTYRYVSVYNKPENSALNNPVKNWELNNLSGSRGEGGSRGQIKVINEDVDIYDGSPIVLFADDWYGSTNISLGGNSENNSKIFFSGHAIDTVIKINAISSSYEFDIGNISEIMKLTETYAISLESHPSPTKWYQMLDMDSRRAIWHYLKFHSTVLFLADLQFLGTDQKIQFFDTDRQSIFDAVDNYMRNTLLGTFVSDRQGKLWSEVGVPFYSNPTGSFPTVMSISRGDWVGEPTIDESLSDSVSFIELGGVAYSGTTTGTYQAFLSQAPGATPNGRGNPDNVTGLAVLSQSQLNTISGNLYASKNAKYPTIDMDMSSGFRNLDIAPLNSVGIDILQSDTSLGLEIHAPYLVDNLNWRYDVTKQILFPDVGLIALVNGSAGETITIPELPDDGGFGNNGFGSGFGFNPVAFPAMLPSLFGYMKYWHGQVTQTDFWVGGTTFTGIVYKAGDPTLVTSSVGQNPVVNEFGTYIIIYHVYVDSLQNGGNTWTKLNPFFAGGNAVMGGINNRQMAIPLDDAPGAVKYGQVMGLVIVTQTSETQLSFSVSATRSDFNNTTATATVSIIRIG